MKIFSVIIGIILCALLIPIAVMNVTITVKTYLYPDKTADFFGFKPFVVVTESMAGTVDGGDIAVVRAVDPSVLKIGDIIAFRDGKSVVTHRITDLTEKDGKPAFIMRGDANNQRQGDGYL